MPVSDDTRIADPNYMQSLARGLDVLRAFERHASLSAAEAARLSGLNRPSASRCLHTLQCLGYVSEENGRYALTPRFLPLASGYLSSSPLASARSEEHTSELQSLMRISYAVFCLKKNTHT